MTNQPLNEEQIRAKYNQKISGNDYLKVAGRILLFRLEYRTAGLLTEPLQFDDQSATFKAWIVIDGVTVATGHARVTAAQAKNAGGRFLQMAETVAMGRALANFGYGTEELADDDDTELADSPVQSMPKEKPGRPVDMDDQYSDVEFVKFQNAIGAALEKHSKVKTVQGQIFREATEYKDRKDAFEQGATVDGIIALIDLYMIKNATKETNAN